MTAVLLSTDNTTVCHELYYYLILGQTLQLTYISQHIFVYNFEVVTYVKCLLMKTYLSVRWIWQYFYIFVNDRQQNRENISIVKRQDVKKHFHEILWK